MTECAALECRPKLTARKRTRSLKKNTPGKKSAVPVFLPNISELIADGEITVGELYSVGCVATATDGHNSLAMLKRRRSETLLQLLTRLDQAIAKAFNEDIFTDEINA